MGMEWARWGMDGSWGWCGCGDVRAVGMGGWLVGMVRSVGMEWAVGMSGPWGWSGPLGWSGAVGMAWVVEWCGPCGDGVGLVGVMMRARNGE